MTPAVSVSRLRRWLLRAAITLLVLCVLLVLGGRYALNRRPDVEITSTAMRYTSDPASTSGLRVTLFGTSTLTLNDGTSTLMIDGFFSRPSFWSFLKKLQSSESEIAFALQFAPAKVDAILVAHAHHDHAMDSGLVAKKTGAVVFGSESTLNISRGQDTPSAQLRLLSVNEPVQVGAFKVRAFERRIPPTPLVPGTSITPCARRYIWTSTVWARTTHFLWSIRWAAC